MRRPFEETVLADVVSAGEEDDGIVQRRYH